MYIDRVRNRNGVETVLVRESYRDEGKVRKRTVANLTHLPPEAQLAVAQALAGKPLIAAEESFEVVRSRSHGHVEAVLTAIRRLGVDRLIATRSSQERELVLGMIASRVLAPASKLATAQWWADTTLAKSLGIEEATEDDLYKAMDWLLERQPQIEKKLAKRHLESCGLVLYDLTSTYVEGTTCPLAKLGYSRDGKANKLQINFGMLTDESGRPISVSVYPGNTADPSTVQDQLRRCQEDFGIEHVVIVGDRGMIAQTTIDKFKESTDIDWITAMKAGGIQKLHAEGSLQLGLFDEKNLFEFTSESFPGERFVACRNPTLAERRKRKRQEMIDATKVELEKIRGMIKRGKLSTADEIGVRVGRIINKYKMAKHFKLEIGARSISYRVRADSVAKEAALDGVYVVRTSVPTEAIDTEDVVRAYKRLTYVEKSFRGMKSSGLEVRPIFHRTENRVRAHIFLCMLAHYVQWHMKHAWRTILFAEETESLPTRDPVAPSKPSIAVKRKKRIRKTDDGMKVQSFKSLLANLASITRNECRSKDLDKTFELTTRPSPLQAKAFDLLKAL